MSGETFRDAWVRVRPVLTWGALASIQLVALVPVWALFAIDTTDLEDWLTDGVPLLLALATQPFLGALVGARLFAVGTSGTKRSPSWLDRFIVGLSTLLLIPLPAEALRRFLVATMVDNPSRAQTESWTWLLVFVPVATICFAAGTIFGSDSPSLVAGRARGVPGVARVGACYARGPQRQPIRNQRLGRMSGLRCSKSALDHTGPIFVKV